MFIKNVYEFKPAANFFWDVYAFFSGFEQRNEFGYLLAGPLRFQVAILFGNLKIVTRIIVV
jgi:hypothetical protein